ncbi:MAG: hypothetical protein ACKV0T_22515 [Planctomycetales bacterium]
MFPSSHGATDLIEELRLRRWARENYTPRDERDNAWHPIVIDEMQRKDDEQRTQEPAFAAGTAEEPAGPGCWKLHDPHLGHMHSTLVLRLPEIGIHQSPE